MKEYIERDKLFQKVLEEKRFVLQKEDMLNQEYVIQTVYGDFADFVNSIPAADVVERKRGEWIKVGESCGADILECSVCHTIHPQYGDAFCRDCGADMRGEKLCTE